MTIANISHFCVAKKQQKFPRSYVLPTLARSEAFPRLRILTFLLLSRRHCVVVSHALLLCSQLCGTPLVVFRPVKSAVKRGHNPASVAANQDAERRAKLRRRCRLRLTGAHQPVSHTLAARC